MVDQPGEPSHIDIVEEYLKKSGGNRLLEIGINECEVVREIRRRGTNVDYTGVDINISNAGNPGGRIIGMDSRDFWKTLTEQDMWNVVFIDGDHACPTVAIDMQEGKKHVPIGGFVLCHDIRDISEKATGAGGAFRDILLADECFSCSVHPNHTDGMAIAQRIK